MKHSSAQWPRRHRRAILTVAALAGLALTVTALPSGAATHASTTQSQVATGSPLTNLDHLDWLSVRVSPPDQEGHTTYGLAEDPAVRVDTTGRTIEAALDDVTEALAKAGFLELGDPA